MGVSFTFREGFFGKRQFQAVKNATLQLQRTLAHYTYRDGVTSHRSPEYLSQIFADHPTPTYVAKVREVRAGLFERLGILERDERPHSLISARDVPFRLGLGLGLRRAGDC